MTPVQPPGGATRGLNLSEWALHHRPMVLFLIVVAAVMGALSASGGSKVTSSG